MASAKLPERLIRENKNEIENRKIFGLAVDVTSFKLSLGLKQTIEIYFLEERIFFYFDAETDCKNFKVAFYENRASSLLYAQVAFYQRLELDQVSKRDGLGVLTYAA